MKTLRTLTLLLVFPLIALAEEGDEKAENPIPADGAERVTTESGLMYSVLKEGPDGGRRPVLGDKVLLHFTGYLSNGKVFQSTRKGAPIGIVLGNVLPAWNEGLALMRPGSEYKFIVPPKLAFGDKGQGVIPGGETTVFIIELIKVIPMPTWNDFDAEKIKKTESGMSIEVLDEGAGEDVKDTDAVEITFAVFNVSKKLVHCTEMTGEKLTGRCSELPLAFLRELAPTMKVGTKMRIRVPAAIGLPGGLGGGRGPRVDAGQDSLWVIEMTRKAAPKPVPEFRVPTADKVLRTDSGLKYEVIAEGDADGVSPKMGETVHVHYAGWMTDGTMFDSSFPRGLETSFQLGRVIPGWNEGLQLMKPGSIYLFEIPAHLAYGANPPNGSKIKPNATLIFYVKLLAVGD